MAIDTSNIFSGLDSARAKIASSIRNAASATGASFEYLVSTAKMESNFNTSAKASTSSARGLFQFIDQTWLGTVKEAGAKLGFGNYADSITKTADGRYTVSDSAKRDEILKLRDDPVASAAMAGVLTQSNSFKLTGALGRRPTDGELYIAHFMGAGAASKLISNAEDNPNKSGPALFPTAAAANRSIFYNRDGSPRTISQVYSVLTSRYDVAASSQSAQSVMASAGVAPSTTRVASAIPAIDNAAYLSQFPQVRTPAPAVQQVAALQTSQEPIFRSLFQAGDRAEPVSPAVRELWGNSSSLTSTLPAPGTAKSSMQMDLFSDRAGVFSS
ncbi:MAG: lytic transglycosylase domain-containing protein [Rhizobiales bacterium]|nr:lytic transglycosylase domain-containing protein [Hyphomicrobiales bacterium]